MNTKKLISMILCLALCFGVLAGCGSKTETPAADAGAVDKAESTEVIELSLGHIYSTAHHEAVALQQLAENLEAASDGRIKLTLYPSSQLGSEREMAEMVTFGTLDMGLSDGPTWSNTLNVPQMAVFGLPFLYNGIDAQAACFDTIIEAATIFMEGTGVKPLFCTSASIRGAMMATKPITSLEDVSGIKMRVPEITMYVDTWKNMGANATTTAWSEAYTSISQGVVDGCEADPATLVDANLHEVTKYFSKTNHMGTIHIISINQAKWDSIPADLQQIILDEAKKISMAQVEAVKEATTASEQIMLDAGIKINEVSAEERLKMIEAEKPLYERFANDYGVGDLITKLQKLGA